MNRLDIQLYHETVASLPESIRSTAWEIGVVCGSGLGGLVDCFEGPTTHIAYQDIAHFPHSTGISKVGILNMV